MVGRTLTELRSELESLADPRGRYYVRCGRTGERPVPIDGLGFPDRGSAVEAARLAHAYRTELRRYDPRAPCYDFVVCERDGGVGSPPATVGAGDGTAPRRRLLAYCHDVAGAVFEALSSGDHGGVEAAVMDRYLATAEQTPDRDRLCLCLLSAMSTQLSARLAPASQVSVLRDATDHLPAVPDAAGSIEAGLGALRSVSLVDGYTLRDAPSADRGSARSRVVTLTGYELPAREGRLPTIPIALEALRRWPDRPVVATDVRRLGDDAWSVTLTSVEDCSRGPASTPVRSA